ncbi:MAG: hypothetical protein AMK73_04970 [Planctomycetes bacterium SM23_32]|nr:MAG: hypothetical protein AMK73_04970 [Planctomycetes bacterium SM23_32]
MTEEPRSGRRAASLLGLPGRLLVAAVAVLVLAGAAAAALLLLPRGMVQWERVERSTLEFLRSEEVMFLVTDRVVTRVDVVARDGSLLMGWQEGVLIGTVEFLCGVDLNKLTAGDVRREGDRLLVTVPEPEVLQVAVDTDSLSFFEKKSGLLAVKQYLARQDTRQELTARLEERAREFISEEGLLPERADLVERLNDLVAPLLASHLSVAVEFR